MILTKTTAKIDGGNRTSRLALDWKRDIDDESLTYYPMEKIHTLRIHLYIPTIILYPMGLASIILSTSISFF